MPFQLIWLGLKKYFSVFQKVGIVFITFFAIIFLFTAFTQADRSRDSVGKPTVAEVEEAKRMYLYKIYDEKNDPVNDEDTATTRKLTRLFMCSMTGELCTSNPSEASDYRKGSFAGFVGKMISVPFTNPPSSFYYWASNTFENAGFIPKTYAAGIGFNALESYRSLWKVFRDLSYLIIVIVIVAVGFMVMFQVGGGGKNAVTLESALPRLVISLLGISFSYALAGLMVDLMYVMVAFVISLLGKEAGLSPGEQVQMTAQVFTGSPASLLWNILFRAPLLHDGAYFNLAGGLYAMIPPFVQRVIEGIIGAFMTNVLIMSAGMGTVAPKGGGIRSAAIRLGNSFKDFIGKVQLPKGLKILDQAKGEGGGAMGLSLWAILALIVIDSIIGILLQGIIVKFLIAMILLLGMVAICFRIFIALIYVYVDIFLSIILSPLIIMLGAIPGQGGIGQWIRGLAVNLAVFPLMLVIVLLARIIMNNTPSSSPMWAPPFVSVVPDQNSLQLVVGGVLLFSLPQILKFFRQKMGAKSMLGDLNLGIGSLFVGAAPIITGASTVLGASGLTAALAKRVTDPFTKMVGLSTAQKVKIE